MYPNDAMKKDKQTVSNYRPISLLPLFAKIFERIIYKNLYNFLVTNNLITKNQSGFTPGIQAPINSYPSFTMFM